MRFHYEGLTIDLASRLVNGSDGPLDVPRRVFDCLAVLIEHRERAVSREELTRAVWHRDNVSDTQLAQTVLRVRRLLGDDGETQRAIRTVPGYGYHFVAALVADCAEAPQASNESASMPIEPAATHAPTPLRSAPPMRAPRRAGLMAFALAAGLLGSLVVTQFPAHQASAPTPRSVSTDRLVVLPFALADGADVGWARLGVMDYVAGRLREQGLSVPPSEGVLARISDGTGPTVFPDALVVHGRAQRLASGWEVILEARRDNGLALHVAGRKPELLAAATAATDALLAALGRVPDSSGAAPTEGLLRVRAALLGNESEAVRELLARLPPAERDSREARYLAAEIDYRGGRLEIARSALDTLLAEPATRADVRFASRALVARGSVLLRLRDDVAAERDFASAIDALNGIDAPRDLGRALLGRGCIAMRQERDADAATDLRRARLLLDTAGDDLAVARVQVNLALIERRGGHPLEALQALTAAAGAFETYGAINEMSVALANIVDIDRSQLRWSDALAAGERAAALLPRLKDPHLRARLQQARAAVLAGLGRLQESRAALDTLDPEVAQQTADDRAATALLRAQALQLTGDTRAADEQARMALGASKDAELIASANLVLARGAAAQARSGEHALLVPDARVRSTSVLLDTGLAADVRNEAGTDTLLHSALERATAVNDAASVRDAIGALVRRLLARSRIDEAAELAARVADHASTDYDSALIVARVRLAQGDAVQARRALDDAATLAGERVLPRDLASRDRLVDAQAVR